MELKKLIKELEGGRKESADGSWNGVAIDKELLLEILTALKAAQKLREDVGEIKEEYIDQAGELLTASFEGYTGETIHPELKDDLKLAVEIALKNQRDKALADFDEDNE